MKPRLIEDSTRGVMFRKGPRSARIACVIARTVAKVTKKEPVEERPPLLAPVPEVLAVEVFDFGRSRWGR